MDRNLPLDVIHMLHYSSMALMLILAGYNLFLRRGCSILSIFCIAQALQAELMLARIPYFLEEYSRNPLSELTYSRAGVGFFIFNLCAIAIFIFNIRQARLHKKLFPISAQETLPMPDIARLILLVTAAIFLVIRFRAPGAGMVMSQGTSVLGGEAFYQLRVELIEASLEGFSRLQVYVEHMLRPILFIGFLVCVLRTFIMRQLPDLFLALFLVGALFIDSLIKFQKGPVAVVTASGMILLLLHTKKPKLSWYVLPLRIVLALAIFGLTSAVVIRVSQGIVISDIGRFIVERFFFVPPHCTSMHFEVFPEMNPYIYFTNFGSVRTILGLESRSVTGVTSIDVAQAMTNLRYNANACTIADAWANAGYWGIFIVGLFTLSVFTFIDSFVSRRRAGIIMTPLIIYYWSGLLQYGNSAIHNLLMYTGVWIVPVLYVVVARSTWISPAPAPVIPGPVAPAPQRA